KFHAGATIPAHIHPNANEFVYVLSGEWEESGVTYTQGAFFFTPRGVAHGTHVAKTQVVCLTIFDGPLTVVAAQDRRVCLSPWPGLKSSIKATETLWQSRSM